MATNSFSYHTLYGSNAHTRGIQPLANSSGPTKPADALGVRSYAVVAPGLLGAEYVRKPHMDIGTRFGQKLRELRHTSGMTQIDVAVMLGMDRSYISEVERGKKGISLATLEIIALGFRLPLSDLLRDL